MGEESIVGCVSLLTFSGCRDGATESHICLPWDSRLESGFQKRVKGETHVEVCSLLQGSDPENSHLKQASLTVKEGETDEDMSVEKIVKCSKIQQGKWQPHRCHWEGN